MNFIRNLDFVKIEFAICQDLERAELGFKCITFNKKYTIVFYQLDDEVIITEFIATKMIYWENGFIFFNYFRIVITKPLLPYSPSNQNKTLPKSIVKALYRPFGYWIDRKSAP